MTHVVTENCIKRKYMDCVTVFHWHVEDLGICQACRLDERLSRAWYAVGTDLEAASAFLTNLSAFLLCAVALLGSASIAIGQLEVSTV